MVRRSSIIQHKKNVITRSSKMRAINNNNDNTFSVSLSSLSDADAYYNYTSKIADLPDFFIKSENKYYWTRCQLNDLQKLGLPTHPYVIVDVSKISSPDVLQKVNDAINRGQIQKKRYLIININVITGMYTYISESFPVAEVANTNFCNAGEYEERFW